MIRTVSTLVLAFSLAACAGGGSEFARAGTGGEMAFERAERARQAGNRGEAITAYRCAAAFGHGYEVAWHALGVTLLDAAAEAGVPPDEAPLFRIEGYEALETAARAGWGASQAELAIRHHQAGNTAEAALWSAIYRTNGREQALGLTRLPQATADAIAANASEAERAAAVEAAADFFPRPLEAGEPGPECSELTAPLRRGRTVDWGEAVRPDVGTSRPGG